MPSHAVVPHPVRDVSRRLQDRRDLTLALATGVVWCGTLAVLERTSWWYPVRPYLASYYITGVLLVPALAWRRRAPLVGSCVTLGASVLLQRAGLLILFTVVPTAIAAFAVVRTGRLSWLRALVPAVAVGAAFCYVGTPWYDTFWQAPPDGVAAAVVAAWPGVDWVGTWSPNWSSLLQVEAVVVFAVLLGHVFRRLEHTELELRQRNAQLVALQRAEADRAVTAERNRISRELHDVVAHHVTAIVVRAQAAAHVARDRPEAAPEALRWIAAEGKEALTATRSMVHVLKVDAAASHVAPGDLVAELQRTAQRVAGDRRVEVELPNGEPVLARETELALVRIAQEALTNAVLHSRAEVVTLALRETGGGWRLVVEDPGPAVDATAPVPAAAPRGGHSGTGGIASGMAGGNGLIHMRERAHAVGGTLWIGPIDGGWRVVADVPRDQVRP